MNIRRVGRNHLYMKNEVNFLKKNEDLKDYLTPKPKFRWSFKNS